MATLTGIGATFGILHVLDRDKDNRGATRLAVATRDVDVRVVAATDASIEDSAAERSAGDTGSEATDAGENAGAGGEPPPSKRPVDAAGTPPSKTSTRAIPQLPPPDARPLDIQRDLP